MPFQVVQTLFTDNSEPVTLVSVTDNQFYICNTGFIPITLEAVVVGPPTGHVFEWELVEYTGNPLIPNPDMSPGTIFGPGDVLQTPPFTFNYTMEFGPPGFPSVFSTSDMYWKFWVDRGTPDEQCLNTVVFFTPTSMLGTCSLTPPAEALSPLKTVSSLNELESRALLFGTTDSRISNLSTVPANPLTPMCIGGKIADKFLTWNVGSNISSDFIDIVVLENATGTFVPVATITDPNLNLFTGTSIGNSYKIRIRTNRGVGNSQFITEREEGPIYIHSGGEPAAFSPMLFSGIARADRNQIRITNYNVLQRTIKTISIPSDFPAEQTSSAPVHRKPDAQIRITNYSVLVRTTKTISIPSDFPAEQTSSAPVHRKPDAQIRITNYTVLDLNGGDIGGG